MSNTERAKIFFDATSLRYLHTGLGQFSFHMLSEFAKSPKDDLEICAITHPECESLVPPSIPVFTTSALQRHGPTFLQRLLFPRCDLWHMSTENTRLTGIPRGAKVVLTVHGLHFLDEESEDRASVMLRKVQELVNRADAITTVSHYTANLVKQRLEVKKEPLTVIYNGLIFSGEMENKPSWAPAKKFIFSIGTFFKRKNFHVLLPMMRALPEWQLVLAGDMSHDYGSFIKSEITRLGLNDQVITPGEISEEEKNWLYQRGEALAFPSVSEGFGIPLIEAFHHGKPVFCARYGSLPEIGSDFAFYWDNFEPEPMATLVREKLTVESRASEEARKTYSRKFSWEQTAREYRQLYQALVK